MPAPPRPHERRQPGAPQREPREIVTPAATPPAGRLPLAAHRAGTPADVPVAIEVGDFIADTLRPFVCGFVTKITPSQTIARYAIQTALGTETIYGPNARLVAPSDAHLARLMANPAFLAALALAQAQSRAEATN